MVTYTIVPRDRAYWIEEIGKDGLRKRIERCDTEDIAVRRLRVLQQATDKSLFRRSFEENDLG